MPSTYTFTVKSPAGGSASTTGERSHYANQPMDGARVAIQGIANGIQTTDATGTPVTSPVTLSSSGSKTLNTPESAIEVIVSNTGATNSMTVSEVSSGSSYTLNSGQTITIPCANMSALYTASSSGTTYSFMYLIV